MSTTTLTTLVMATTLLLTRTSGGAAAACSAAEIQASAAPAVCLNATGAAHNVVTTSPADAVEAVNSTIEAVQTEQSSTNLFINNTIHRHARELGDMTSGWSEGRCTWYGGPGGPGPDGMNIYTGSCGYKNKLPHNDYIAAAQTMGGYDWGLTGECGRCYEVMCVPGRTRGLANSALGPWQGCLDPGRRSVVVMISDSCPCHHPNSGNKRWCCGDERHLDLSYSAFDAIAQRDKGVVDLKIRPVSCDLAGQSIYYGGASMIGGVPPPPSPSPPPPTKSG
jgi:Lytic transglycolase